MRFGLLMPHFGASCDRDLLFTGAQRAEALGFDSLWVRDHLVFEPHDEFEEPSRKFFESLTTLTALGSVTKTIGLGTGALTPSRHPIMSALTLASMSQLLGDRLIVGMGAGSSNEEFAAIGLGGVDRTELAMENIEILQRLWSGESVTHHGPVFDFDDVSLETTPVAKIPIWYCGNTPASVRRAASTCDGWLPGRIGLATLHKRVEMLLALSEERGRPAPSVGIIPTTSIDPDRAQALARANVNGLLEWANHAKFWVKPASGRFERLEDLAGILLVGSPDDVVEGCEQLRESGVEHVVFDFRMDFSRWVEQVELLAEEVLPSFASVRGPSRAAAV